MDDANAKRPPYPPPVPDTLRTMYYMRAGVVYSSANWAAPTPHYPLSPLQQPPPAPSQPPPPAPAPMQPTAAVMPTHETLQRLRDDLLAEMQRAFAQHTADATATTRDTYARVARDTLECIAAIVRLLHPDARVRVLMHLLGVAYVHVDSMPVHLIWGYNRDARQALLDAQLASDLDFGCGFGTRAPLPTAHTAAAPPTPARTYAAAAATTAGSSAK